jgi:hypothetical protein
MNLQPNPTEFSVDVMQTPCNRMGQRGANKHFCKTTFLFSQVYSMPKNLIHLLQSKTRERKDEWEKENKK